MDKEPVTTEKVIEMLQWGIAQENAAALQYLQHHYRLKGKDQLLYAEHFKKFSVEEMKHSYKMAERVVMLGGEPTPEIPRYRIGKSLEEMAQIGLEEETDAINHYRQFIEAIGDFDPVSRMIFEEALEDEEEHLWTFKQMLGG